jgi:hypothetical protein
MPREDFLGLRAEAAGDDHLAVFGQRLADGLERLVDRGIDEAAGIHHDEVGGAIAGRDLIPFGAQAREDTFGIDQGFGASQADEAHLGRVAPRGRFAGSDFQEDPAGALGKTRHSTPTRSFDREIALSNAPGENRDAVLRKAG